MLVGANFSRSGVIRPVGGVGVWLGFRGAIGLRARFRLRFQGGLLHGAEVDQGFPEELSILRPEALKPGVRVRLHAVERKER